MSKPNCYDCKHRGDLPGDAHSICRHPDVAKLPVSAIETLLGMMGKRGDPTKMILPQAWINLQIVGDAHGIEKGWFCWPLNFDPVWLESCNGFEAKRSEDEKIERKQEQGE